MAVITKKSKPQMSFPPFSVFKKVFSLWISVAVCLSFSSCENKQEEKKANPVFALNTVFEQKLWGSEDKVFSDNVLLLKEYEAVFSHTFSSSEVYDLNQSGEGEISDKLKKLIIASLKASEDTNGAFDFTYGALFDLWDFEKGIKPTETEIAEALSQGGYEKPTFSENSFSLNGTKLNFGGIAKGAAVGEMLKSYVDSSVEGGVISCSSAVGVCGSKPDGSLFKIGIRHPEKTNEHLALLEITDCLISTSGDYERFFTDEDGEKYHHIIDTKTGYPVKTDIRSVTVVADITGKDDLFTLGAYTDALSTALFSMGMTEDTFRLLDEYSMEAVFVTDTAVFVTDGLCDSITVTSSHTLKKAVG